MLNKSILILLILVILFILIISIYIIKRIYKLNIINKLNKYIKIIISLIPIILLIIFISLDSLIVYIYSISLIILIDLITYKIDIKYKDLVLLISIIISSIYFINAYNNCNNFRETTYNIKSDKNVSSRMVMISDLHLGTTLDYKDVDKMVDSINNNKPDFLFIVGDMVDDKSDYELFKYSCNKIGNINTKYGIYYVYGNHDLSINKNIFNVLLDNNIKVLRDEVVYLDDYYIIGRLDNNMSRKSISSLTKDLKDKYIIDLNHQPTDYENESKENIDLVLSGHTHGAQMILLKLIQKIYQFNDNIYGYKRINNTDFIVSSGIGSWNINFKTGTYSEYVVININ